MLSLARRAIAAFHCSARCRAHIHGAKLRPKADLEQIHKVGGLLRTHAGIDEEAFARILNNKKTRYLSAVPLEQLSENLAFWRRQFGFTKDDLNAIVRNKAERLTQDPGLLAARWATLKQTLGEERLGQYARLGLSTDEVLSAYRRNPLMMANLRDTVDAVLELGYDSSMKDKLLNSAFALSILNFSSAKIRQTADVLRKAGYSPKAISLLVASSNFPAGSAPQTLARSLAYVRDVMGRRLEDIKPAVVVLKSVPRNLAPRYTALHKVHGAALDDMTNVNKNTMIFWAESDFLKYGRITREAYDEVRRLTVPRFAVLWEEGEPLPPPDVALIEGDEAFLQRVGRADLLPKVAAARVEAGEEKKKGKRGTRKASRA